MEDAKLWIVTFLLALSVCRESCKQWSSVLSSPVSYLLCETHYLFTDSVYTEQHYHSVMHVLEVQY